MRKIDYDTVEESMDVIQQAMAFDKEHIGKKMSRFDYTYGTDDYVATYSIETRERYNARKENEDE